MAIITISRGAYSQGKEIAERVADRLGYECIAREVLLEASQEFNIPELKLLHAIQDAPSILDRLTYGKEKYIAYIQAALLKHLQRDNVVYHGFAGHFFVREIPHVLKVRVIADLEQRVRIVMERDRVSRKEALRFVKKLDDQRRRWSRHLYGIDTWDPGLYDLVVHIHKITVDDAVEIIACTAGLERFRTTAESARAMDDLVLAAEVQATLVAVRPDVKVTASGGVVHVQTRAPASRELELAAELKAAAQRIPGVVEVRVEVLPLSHYAMDWASPA